MSDHEPKRRKLASSSGRVVPPEKETLQIPELEFRPTLFCHIDSLPDELLAAIIRCLSYYERVESAELVSKRWYRVARHSGWSDVTVFDNRNHRDHEVGGVYHSPRRNHW